MQKPWKIAMHSIAISALDMSNMMQQIPWGLKLSMAKLAADL